MPRLRRRRLPIVMTAVEIAHRRARKLGWVHIVETGDIDAVIVAADLFDMAAPKGVDAALPAEEVALRSGPESIVRQIAFAAEEPTALRLPHHPPLPPL